MVITVINTVTKSKLKVIKKKKFEIRFSELPLVTDSKIVHDNLEIRLSKERYRTNTDVTLKIPSTHSVSDSVSLSP